MDYDKILLKILITDKDRINSCQMLKIINNKYPNIKTYLTNRYCDSESLQESLNRIKYNIDIRPVCKICGGKVKYIGKNIFRNFCSYKCLGNGTNNRRKQTCLEKYGASTLLKNKEVKEKIKQTCLEKYGVPNAGGSKQSLEKIKQTCLEKYGVKTFCKSEEYLKQKDKIINKIYYSRKKNGTLNTSKLEEELYLYIKDRFPSVKRQYKDEKRYPFYCDFYIPELDYFIELNGIWTHGKHPYDFNSVEDQLILKEWKSKVKNHPFYNNAIETWTKRDVGKRNKAKQNNLNYKEVWSVNEGKKFIDKILWQIKIKE